LTVAEALLASAVLAAGVVAAGAAVGAALGQASYCEQSQRAIRLAEEMVERLRAMPYRDPQGSDRLGPEPDEFGVGSFDNADDFHGLVEAPGTVADIAGRPYPREYQDFRRSVSAQYTTSTLPGLDVSVPGLAVTVTVTDPRGRAWTLKRFLPEPVE
jgi:hypothetical protein